MLQPAGQEIDYFAQIIDHDFENFVWIHSKLALIFASECPTSMENFSQMQLFIHELYQFLFVQNKGGKTEKHESFLTCIMSIDYVTFFKIGVLSP